MLLARAARHDPSLDLRGHIARVQADGGQPGASPVPAWPSPPGVGVGAGAAGSARARAEEAAGADAHAGGRASGAGRGGTAARSTPDDAGGGTTQPPRTLFSTAPDDAAGGTTQPPRTPLSAAHHDLSRDLGAHVARLLARRDKLFDQCGCMLQIIESANDVPQEEVDAQARTIVQLEATHGAALYAHT